MKNFLNGLNADISKVKFRYVILTFIISVSFPALLMAIEGNEYYFKKYLSGNYSLELYLRTLGIKFLFIYFIGCLLALIFGVPVFYTLRSCVNFNPLNVFLVAASIAILPNVIIEILSSSDGVGTYYVGKNDCTIIENGKRTLCGWKHFWLNNIFLVALRGASAGIIFWYIIRKFAKPLS